MKLYDEEIISTCKLYELETMYQVKVLGYNKYKKLYAYLIIDDEGESITVYS